MQTLKYRIYKNGEKMGVFTRVQACRMLCISSETFRKYVYSGELYNEVYKIEEVTEEQTKSSKNLKIKALEEWDRVRFMVNPKAKGWQEYVGSGI